MSTPVSILDWGRDGGYARFGLLFWPGGTVEHTRPSHQKHQKFCHVDCGSGRATESFCTCRQYKNVDILILNRIFISINNSGREIEWYDNDRSLATE